MAAAKGDFRVKLRRVAILCAARKTAYRDIRGLDIYDIDRDARTFSGSEPVIAHPPCRTWSAFCRHQIRLSQEEIQDEQNLGFYCVDTIMENGGILEQPAHSHLFTAAGLPLPGKHTGTDDSWSALFWQKQFGCKIRKRTWLWFRHIPPRIVRMPFVLLADDPVAYENRLWKRNPRNDRERWQQISDRERSATPPAFARWLVKLARTIDH